MNWYKQANITQTWDKYLEKKVMTQIPNKEDQFYQNFRQGLINAEQLFDNERAANSFINTYLAKNVMSLTDVDTGHIGDRIFSDIRSSFQATLPAEQRQSIKMNEVKQILLRELPGFKEEQINALAQDFVFNNKNTYEEIKKLKGDEVTDTKKLINREGIYSLYQITNWGTNGKLEKHIDPPHVPTEVHKDLESTSVCVRFASYFDTYMRDHGGLSLIEEFGKPYIMISGDGEIKWTENDVEIFEETPIEDFIKNKDLFKILDGEVANMLNEVIQTGNIEMVQLALDLGAKPGEYTLNEAIITENIEMVQLVVDLGAKPDKYTLSHAVQTVDIKMVQLAIDLGAKPNELTLSSAVGTGSLEIAQLVIQAGAKPDEYSLHYALWTKNPVIVQLVVQAGAKPNEDTLYQAINTRDPEIVKLAIQIGAKPNVNTLGHAINTRNLEIVQLVIQAGAKPDKQTLNFAIKTKNIEMMKLVIQAGAKPNEYTLHWAMETKNPEIVKLAIQAGAQPNKYTLNDAIKTKNPEIIDLIKRLPVVNASNKNWYRQVKVSALTDMERMSLEAPGGKIEQEVNIGGYDLFISSLPFFGENMPRY